MMIEYKLPPVPMYGGETVIRQELLELVQIQDESWTKGVTVAPTLHPKNVIGAAPSTIKHIYTYFYTPNRIEPMVLSHCVHIHLEFSEL